MKKTHWTGILLSISFVSCLASELGDSGIANDITVKKTGSRLTGPISKSPSDSREYRGIVLANEMKVLLISDPNTTEGAASLCISAGSMNNPEGLPGLAHFAEHMLFFGNEKYPEEKSYEKYVAEHGGEDNAGTDMDITYYYFSVGANFLANATDRFANLFISPLFPESGIEREVNAVNSEHQKNTPNDKWRFTRIFRSTTKPDHPHSYFTTGNIESLWTKPRENSTDIRKSLLEFYESFYSSNLMNLVILGKESLDELQLIVEDVFIDISNRNVTKPVWDSPYGTDELQERIEIVPMGSERSVVITFPIPYIPQAYKTTAGGYLSELLGREGDGSLTSLLKNKLWADSVKVVTNSPGRGFTTFEFDIILTEEGLQNVDSVISHVFEAIKMVRDSGPQKWFWEELRDLNKIHFQFSDQETPIDLVQKLSAKMDRYPIEAVLHADGVEIDAQFDPLGIQNTVELLTPENCRIFVTSKDFLNTTKYEEKYYGIKYNREKLDPELIKEWNKCGSNKDLYLPTQNEYIPSEFNLKQLQEEPVNLFPRILNNSEFSQIWYHQENKLLLPKAFVRVEILSPAAYMDPLSANLNSIYANLVLKSISDFQNNAKLAGLKSEIISTVSGLEITVQGFDHKLGPLIQKILQNIANIEINPMLFKTVNDSRFRELNNRKNEQPHTSAKNHLKLILWQQSASTDELISVMNEVTVDRFNVFVNQFLSRIKFRWLFYGNLTPNESLAIASEGQNLFTKRGSKPIFPSQVWAPRYIKLQPGASYITKTNHTSHTVSCAVVLFQIGMDEPRTNVLTQLLDQVAYDPAYNQLRTKEQLGYSAWTDIYYVTPNGPSYFKIIVQGDHHPTFVESRIDSFIEDLNLIIKNMTLENFDRNKEALRSQKLSKPKTLEKLGKKIWEEIQSESYNFDRLNVELNELHLIKLEDLNSFFDKMIASNSVFRSRLAVHMISMAEGGAGRREINNSTFNVTQSEEILHPAHWKKQHGLFPSIKPFNTSTILF